MPPSTGYSQCFEIAFHLGQAAIFAGINRRKEFGAMLNSYDQNDFVWSTPFNMEGVIEGSVQSFV